MPNPMYGPFSAGTGASFADADWRDMFTFHLTDGVIAGVLSALAVSAGATTTINVASGQGYLRGLHYKGTSTTNLAIAASNPTNPRIDLVVLHANLAGGQTVALQVITGTPAASPVAPTVVQTEGTAWEIALAQVLVHANDSSSAQYTITDVRSFSQALISALGITTAMLAAQAVTAAKIANNTITAAQIVNATITATQIANATITGTQLASSIALPGTPTVNSGNVAGIRSAGGGSAGITIWVGTTDPAGSAGEGDVWISA
jgi:hypothetical protein